MSEIMKSNKDSSNEAVKSAVKRPNEAVEMPKRFKTEFFGTDETEDNK